MQGLLLAFVRGPGGHHEHFERRRDAAVGIGEAFGVDFADAYQERAADRNATAICQDVAGAHGAEFLHETECGGIADAHDFGVDDGEGEAGALEKTTQIADVGEGGDAGGGATCDFGFGLEPGAAQFLERGATEQAADKQAVGLQAAADLEEGAGQVIDSVKGERRDDQIEACISEGDRLLVGEDGQL